MLVLADHLAEGAPLAGVLDAGLQRVLGDAVAHRGDHQAAAGEAVHGEGGGRADALLAADDGLRADGDLVEQQLEQRLAGHPLVPLADPQPGLVHRQHEGGGPRVRALAVAEVGGGDHQGDPGVFGVADECLAPVQHPGVAGAHGGGGEVEGVRAGLRLGERQAAGLLAAHQRDEVALDLLGGAVPQQRAGAVGAGQRVRGEHAAAASGGVVQQHDGDERHVGAAEFLRVVAGVEAERGGALADVGPQVGRDLVGGLGQLGGERDELAADEALEGVDEFAVAVFENGGRGAHAPTSLRSASASRNAHLLMVRSLRSFTCSPR